MLPRISIYAYGLICYLVLLGHVSLLDRPPRQLRLPNYSYLDSSLATIPLAQSRGVYLRRPPSPDTAERETQRTNQIRQPSEGHTRVVGAKRLLSNPE